jgi:hypothetical protein
MGGVCFTFFAETDYPRLWDVCRGCWVGLSLFFQDSLGVRGFYATSSWSYLPITHAISYAFIRRFNSSSVPLLHSIYARYSERFIGVYRYFT